MIKLWRQEGCTIFDWTATLRKACYCVNFLLITMSYHICFYYFICYWIYILYCCFKWRHEVTFLKDLSNQNEAPSVFWSCFDTLDWASGIWGFKHIHFWTVLFPFQKSQLETELKTILYTPSHVCITSASLNYFSFLLSGVCLFHCVCVTYAKTKISMTLQHMPYNIPCLSSNCACWAASYGFISHFIQRPAPAPSPLMQCRDKFSFFNKSYTAVSWSWSSKSTR